MPTFFAKVPFFVYAAAMITARQIRAARALIGWTQRELATSAGLSLAVVNNCEREATDVRSSTLRRMQEALESAGIEFLGDRQNSPDGGLGVRIRPQR